MSGKCFNASDCIDFQEAIISLIVFSEVVHDKSVIVYIFWTTIHINMLPFDILYTCFCYTLLYPYLLKANWRYIFNVYRDPKYGDRFDFIALVETRYLVTLSDHLSTSKIMSILVGAKDVQFCSSILMNNNKIAYALFICVKLQMMFAIKGQFGASFLLLE